MSHPQLLNPEETQTLLLMYHFFSILLIDLFEPLCGLTGCRGCKYHHGYGLA
jgi:hypothetical protein